MIYIPNAQQIDSAYRFMLGLILGVVLMLVMAERVCAAGFVVSDPWPNGAPQPTHCLYQEGTAAPVETAVVVDAGGLAYCKIAASALPPALHGWQVWVRNASEVSPKTAFSFDTRPIPAPANLRIVAP